MSSQANAMQSMGLEQVSKALSPRINNLTSELDGMMQAGSLDPEDSALFQKKMNEVSYLSKISSTLVQTLAKALSDSIKNA